MAPSWLVIYHYSFLLATKHLKDTYQNYSNQHHAFVTHAETTIEGLISKISELQEEITKANTGKEKKTCLKKSVRVHLL